MRILFNVPSFASKWMFVYINCTYVCKKSEKAYYISKWSSRHEFLALYFYFFASVGEKKKLSDIQGGIAVDMP